MSEASNKDELVAQYSNVTGESASESRHHLEAFAWDLNSALEDYYARQQDSDHDPDYLDDNDDHSEDLSGGRRLGDGTTNPQPEPVTQSSSKATAQPAAQKKFATLGDFSSGTAKEESDSEDNQDLFAGGEKSGLAVQNPDDLKKRILEKAQKSGGRREKTEPEKKSNFAGAARTLGGDEAPSREIPAAPQPRARGERVDRTLHFWNDGFSVDDGELYRADDPANASILNLIRQGRAPLHIMNVQPGQDVDVEIKQHDENYVKPKKKYRAFEGQGNRLGSPTPGTTTNTMPGAFSTEPAAPTAAAATSSTVEVDESKPTVTIRISLGSGTRLTSRFNTDSTIGDIYAFVERAESNDRSFVLQTTFPTTDLTDKTKVLGEMAEFKRGGAVVQKYT